MHSLPCAAHLACTGPHARGCSLLCRRVSQVVLHLSQLAAASVHSHDGSDMQQMTAAHDRLFVVSSLTQGVFALTHQSTYKLPPQDVLPVCHAAAHFLLTGGCGMPCSSSSLEFEGSADMTDLALGAMSAVLSMVGSFPLEVMHEFATRSLPADMLAAWLAAIGTAVEHTQQVQHTGGRRDGQCLAGGDLKAGGWNVVKLQCWNPLLAA